jgi:hypothetical protein
MLVFISTAYAQIELTPLAYQFKLKYSEGNISFDPASLVLLNTYLPDLNNQPEDDAYRAELISFSDQPLYTYKFHFPLEVFSDPGEECFNATLEFDSNLCPEFKPYYELTNSEVILTIPYFPTGKYINIYDQDSLILKIDVRNFSDFCGNSICEPEEKGICNLDCGKIKNTWLNPVNIVIIIFIIIIIFSFLIYKRYKSKPRNY